MKQLKNFECNDYNDVSDREVVDGIMGKYKDMNEDQLVDELMKAVQSAKEDGSFSEELIKNFYELVSPNLSSAQREKLYSLINLLLEK